MINLYEVLSLISVQNVVIINYDGSEKSFNDYVDAQNELPDSVLNRNVLFIQALEDEVMFIQL